MAYKIRYIAAMLASQIINCNMQVFQNKEKQPILNLFKGIKQIIYNSLQR